MICDSHDSFGVPTILYMCLVFGIRNSFNRRQLLLFPQVPDDFGIKPDGMATLGGVVHHVRDRTAFGAANLASGVLVLG